ncbi:MAG: hypothetical protein ACREM6_13755 [Vulcanimicrobiaceae bacterium]
MRSTIAILRNELDASWIRETLAAVLVAAIAARFSFPNTDGNAIWLATLFGGLVGLHVRRSRAPRVAYLAAPIYGRELARALALPAILAALIAAWVLCAIAAVRGVELNAAFVALPSAAAVVAALTAQAAMLRSGQARLLYLALGYTAVGAIAAAAGLLPAPIALLLACGLGYAALRSLAETLARYDAIGS